jgi:hypothetical protein
MHLFFRVLAVVLHYSYLFACPRILELELPSVIIETSEKAGYCINHYIVNSEI